MALANDTTKQNHTAPFKVLMSAYACRPNTGSEVGTGWNWVLHLAEAGCELHVFTAARNREANEKFLAEHSLPNLHFHFVDVPWMSPWSPSTKHYLLWKWKTWQGAKELIRTERFELALHVSYGSVHFPTQLWRLGIPTIFGPVGGGQTAPAALLRYFGTQQRGEKLRTLATRILPMLPFYRHSMRKMRMVLAANSDTVALARRAGAQDIRLMCDTGLREDYAAEGPRQFVPSEKIRFVWVGRFHPRKGLGLALDALQHAADNIHLTLVGDGLKPGQLDAMLAERGLSNRVHWSGQRQSWMEVRDTFRQHDALLFTSLRDTFGSQLLEAMSQGLPFVTLSMSGARDFLPPDGGFKVEPGEDADQTVQRMTAALNKFAALTIEERNRMSEVVWQSAQGFSWERRVETMQEIFTEVRGDRLI